MVPLLYNSKALRLSISRILVGGLKPSQFSLQNHLLLYRHLTSSQISPPNQQDSNFTVNYLINSCGLSPEGAMSASKWVHLQSPENPDAVLGCLKDHGFSKTHITTLVRSRPRLLLSNPEKTLLPKLKFFLSLGVSQDDVVKNLAFRPLILTRSLEKWIVPTYNFLRSILSEKNVVAVFKCRLQIFMDGHEKNVVPNIRALRELGMPQSCISLLLAHYTHVVMLSPEKFGLLVGEVKEMGFDLKISTSVNALRALCGSTKLRFNRGCQVFRRYGFSEADVVSAVLNCPQCMIVSEKKIVQAMDFLVNEMGWRSSVIAKNPFVVCHSFEKRIKPRCSVVKVLLLKGLMDDNFSLSYVVKPVEKKFLERFVNRYLGEVPELLSVYQGKVGIKDV